MIGAEHGGFVVDTGLGALAAGLHVTCEDLIVRTPDGPPPAVGSVRPRPV